MSLQWCGNVTSITIFLNTCPLKYIFIIEKTKTNKLEEASPLWKLTEAKLNSKLKRIRRYKTNNSRSQAGYISDWCVHMFGV